MSKRRNWAWTQLPRSLPSSCLQKFARTLAPVNNGIDESARRLTRYFAHWTKMLIRSRTRLSVHPCRSPSVRAHLSKSVFARLHPSLLISAHQEPLTTPISVTLSPFLSNRSCDVLVHTPHLTLLLMLHRCPPLLACPILADRSTHPAWPRPISSLHVQTHQIPLSFSACSDHLCAPRS